jgi:hypothetical protein
MPLPYVVCHSKTSIYIFNYFINNICLNIKAFLTKYFLFPLFRGGRGGGYKELDEEELEEVKRRRKEADEVGCLQNITSFCL